MSCVGAFSTHIFADDLSALIVPPIDKDIKRVMEFVTKKGTQVCQNLLDCSRKWNQSINVAKTVVQLFHDQVIRPNTHIHMGENLLENVRAFNYLGIYWIDKLFLAPTVIQSPEKIQKSYIKLKWLKRNRYITTKVLRTCFFSYSFPFFVWLFPFFPMLPKTQQEALKSKSRVRIRIIHRCIFTSATTDLFVSVNECRLEE